MAIKRHLPLSFLCLILTALFLSNYTPGTYLAGWDNLLPELNIWMNLKRSLFAVWQQYQGLGLVGGMGHATDLIRQLIILPLTLILPNSIIRYLWHYACLAFGTFGIYTINRRLFKLNPSISVLGSLFYLLNFGTIQYFWVPFEPFSTFWSFFPWLMFYLWQYLTSPSHRHLLNLAIINLLAIPSFYVPTIFIVYLLCVFIVMFSALFVNHKSYILNLKLLFIIILINSFWLLPFCYFLLSGNVANTTQAIGNLMSTEESVMRNSRRGYIPDFLLLRGYYVDFPHDSSTLLAPWTQYQTPIILAIGYSLSLFVILGLIKVCQENEQNKNLLRGTMVGVFLLSAIALLSSTPPFSYLNDLIRQLPLINQVFRAPWTKFLVPAAFSFSLLFSIGINSLNQLFTKRFNYLLPITCYLLLFIYSFPLFRGQLFLNQMHSPIPQEYSQLIDYFKTQPSTARIANLPQGSFWGWTNYRFGMLGSGFLWYGLEQPILDRAFDVWNLNNENYYWQLSTALETRNSQLLPQILSQYSIQYLIYDNNVYFPDEFIYSKISLATYLDILNQTPGLTLAKQFGSISVYQYSQPTQPYLVDSLPNYPQSNLATNRTPLANLDYLATNPPLDLQSRSDGQDPHSLVHLNTTNNSQLISYDFPSALFNQAYLARIIYRHRAGLPLTLSANSDNRKYKYFYTHLDTNPDQTVAWFVLPKMETFSADTGINIVFNNASYSFQPSINEIQAVDLFPIDANLLSTPTPSTPSRTYLASTSNIFHYRISLPNIYDLLSTTYLVLPQSYDPGWLAFYFDGLKPVFLHNHTQVNNWANGWTLPMTSDQRPVTIYILFWPQLLEFLGFGLLLLSFFYLAFSPLRAIFIASNEFFSSFPSRHSLF